MEKTDKSVYIIGTGMDGDRTLTKEAEEAIKNADELIGAKRVLEKFSRFEKAAFISYDAEKIAAHIAESVSRSTAVLTSGDSGFYSAARSLLPLLKGLDVSVLPGISTPSYLCAKLKTPWQDMHFVSLHGRSGAVVRPVCSHGRTFFLLGGCMSAADVCERLTEYGLGNLTVHIGENLSLQGERIISAPARDLTGIKTGGLCALLVENPNFERKIPSCIKDGEFIRGKTPMTKAEVRCLCVSKLGIEEKSVCWDVGAGTGSVSVEMALRCGGGSVYAIERDGEAILLIEQNRRKFGCDNIEIAEGEAPEALRTLPVPDRVFIGGSGGRLKEIASVIKEKNPEATVFLTAVTAETLKEAGEIFGEDREITQISVTRTKRVGASTMFFAENPVFTIGGRLR